MCFSFGYGNAALRAQFAHEWNAGRVHANPSYKKQGSAHDFFFPSIVHLGFAAHRKWTIPGNRFNSI
jgi:hypothetical protein